MSEGPVASKCQMSVVSLALLLVMSPTSFAAPPAQAVEILRKVEMVSVSSLKKFVAADLFIVNHRLLGRVPGLVKIGNLRNAGMPNDNFERYLLGTIDLDVPATALSVYRVQQTALDSIVRGMIDDWVPIQLSDVYGLLARQPNGERGVLLTNGGLNYFHVRDKDGRVWILQAHWPDASGWSIQALSSPVVVLRGSQVISF